MELFNAKNKKLKQIAKVLAFVFVFAFSKIWGQVLVTTTSYIQNFGTTDVTAWTDNSTYLGWYATDIAASLHQNITAALPTNTGGFYTYECNGNNDQKIGGRASGGTGTIQYGVLFRNQTGMPFVSMRVSYKGSQLSLAQNGNNINTITFSYATSAAALTLASAGYVNVPALNFVQLQNSAVAGSNQINSYICSQETNITSCIVTNIPNNNYFMLRWTDVDDGSNDHHMAIDNLQVDFGIVTDDCLTILPIDLIDFYTTKKDNSNHIIWKVADETNVESYMIEKSEDGLNFSLLENITLSQGITDNTSIKTYLVVDENPFEEFTYYRLGTKSKDGSNQYYKIITVDENSNDWKTNYYQKNGELTIEFKNLVPKNSTISLFDLSGKLLAEENIKDSQTKIHVQNLAEGLYFVKIQSPYKTDNFKIIIQK
jgi:hypothetical protein